MKAAYEHKVSSVNLLRAIKKGARNNRELVELGFSEKFLNSHLGILKKHGYVTIEERDWLRWPTVTPKGDEFLSQFREEPEKTELDARKYLQKKLNDTHFRIFHTKKTH